MKQGEDLFTSESGSENRRGCGGSGGLCVMFNLGFLDFVTRNICRDCQ